MMKTRRAIQFVAAAFVLSFVCISATAQEIKYNFLPGTDFAKYKTYKWVRVPNAQYPNQILDGQIMRAIDRVGPSYINLRSAVSYGGPTNRAATTQEKSLLLDSVINLTKNLVRAHDIILDQRLVDSEEMKRLVQQRSKLSAYVTRSIHQKTRNNSRSRLSQRADEERRFPHAKKVVSEVRGASRNGFATGGEEEGVMGMEDSDSGKRKLMDQFAEQERRAAETALAT